MESVVSSNATQGQLKRLAWAMLVSLLVHLMLMGDLPRLFPWQAVVSSVTNATNPRLEARLSPLAENDALPARTDSFVPPPPPVVEPEPAMQAASPIPEGVVSVDRASKPAEEAFAQPAESLLAQARDEPRSDRVRQRLPPSGKLVYRFYWGESRWLAGLATHQWVLDNGNYTLSSNVSTTGVFALLHPTTLIETSQGTVVGDRLRPQMFTTQYNELPPAIAYFNWTKGYFRWYRATNSFTQPLPDNAYDKISFLYQLYVSAQKEDFYSSEITTGRRLEHYDIRSFGVEEVDIDGKGYPAIHLKRMTATADAEQVEIWLSISDNLPIKMTYSNSAGDHFEQLISAESIPAKLGTSVAGDR